MEPVTHILTGACLARSGLNRRAAYATLTMAIAAEFPDIDVLWSLRGPVESFQHHRGITHTFLGIPFEAALVVAGVYGLHRWRVARHQQHPHDRPNALAPKPLTAAPLRWGFLYLCAILALCSHLLLDLTNNYGLRPFFPFDPRWFAGSIVFIFDPLIFALLLFALVAPWLFGLIGAEVGARPQPFRARGWSLAAFAGIIFLWGLRTVEHDRAIHLADAQILRDPPPASDREHRGPTEEEAAELTGPAPPATPPVYLSPERVLASPDMLNPFRWYTITDFGPAYQLAEVDSHRGFITPADPIYFKPVRSPEVLAAMGSPLGRAYLDWSPMPIITSDAGPESSSESHAVTFRDPRFFSGMAFFSTADHPPLTGMVLVSRDGAILAQGMDGRTQH